DIFNHSKDFITNAIGPFHLSESKESMFFETPIDGHGSLNDNNVNAIYRDDAGILWVGTRSGGVNKADLNASKFQSVQVKDDGTWQPGTASRSMWVDHSGVWLGTDYNGLIYPDKATRNQRYVATQLAGENIKALLKDHKGYIWIGKRTGLDRYDPATGKLVSCFKTSGNPSRSRFYAIAEDPLNQDLWFSHYSGMYKYSHQ